MNDFEKRVAAIFHGGLHSVEIGTIQVNLGLRCNQMCKHCHLGASPYRTETMEWSTMDMVVAACRRAHHRQRTARRRQASRSWDPPFVFLEERELHQSRNNSGDGARTRRANRRPRDVGTRLQHARLPTLGRA